MVNSFQFTREVRLHLTHQIPQMDADSQTYAIIGAAMEVHRFLGPGFLEGVYQEALSVELSERAVPYVREGDVPVFYKGMRLVITYRPDFIRFQNIILELKAQAHVGRIEEAQIINYLKVSGVERGLLFNFGLPSLQFRRFVNSTPLAPSV